MASEEEVEVEVEAVKRMRGKKPKSVSLVVQTRVGKVDRTSAIREATGEGSARKRATLKAG